MNNKIRCQGVRYRQGFIEVLPSVHASYINLEVWTVSPEVDLANHPNGLQNIEDEACTGNTEIELNAQEAKLLIELLQNAVDSIERAA